MDSAKAADDYSDELNGVIKKCCGEFLPTGLYMIPAGGEIVKAVNADKWYNGVFNNWDFVAKKWWEDRPRENYYSYIPDDIQKKVPTSKEDYFVLNGHKMNREQFGNYVKGATAQYAFPGILTSSIVNILGLSDSVKNNILYPDRYGFSLENELDDSYYTYLGAWDMTVGNIK